MSFAIIYFNKLIFVKKNWLNDLDAIFKKELKEIEGAFENDEVVEI
jgi:hypothetical protein